MLVVFNAIPENSKAREEPVGGSQKGSGSEVTESEVCQMSNRPPKKLCAEEKPRLSEWMWELAALWVIIKEGNWKRVRSGQGWGDGSAGQVLTVQAASLEPRDKAWYGGVGL